MATVALDYALAEWLLNEYPFSYIHEALIYRKIEDLYKVKQYNGQKISYITRDSAPDNAFYSKISSLQYGGFIKPIGNDLHASVYAIPSKPEHSNEEIVCAVYPQGYISHISAMRWHNITHKNPKTVHYTAPSRNIWKEKTSEKTARDLGISNSTPKFFIPYPSSGKQFGFELEVSQEGNYVEPMQVRGSPIRVSGISKTFIDMTRHPSISGGIDHVIDIFEEHGPKFSKQIIKYAETSGTKIDRARVGFLLRDIAKVKSSSFEAWIKEAEHLRGGSRKFNPDESYEPFYSSEWTISLNVEKLHQYAKHA